MFSGIILFSMWVKSSFDVSGGQSLSAPAMLMSHATFCLQVFMGKGTTRIGEPLQGHLGPTLNSTHSLNRTLVGVLGLNNQWSKVVWVIPLKSSFLFLVPFSCFLVVLASISTLDTWQGRHIPCQGNFPVQIHPWDWRCKDPWDQWVVWDWYACQGFTKGSSVVSAVMTSSEFENDLWSDCASIYAFHGINQGKVARVRSCPYKVIHMSRDDTTEWWLVGMIGRVLVLRNSGIDRQYKRRSMAGRRVILNWPLHWDDL